MSACVEQLCEAAECEARNGASLDMNEVCFPCTSWVLRPWPVGLFQCSRMVCLTLKLACERRVMSGTGLCCDPKPGVGFTACRGPELWFVKMRFDLQWMKEPVCCITAARHLVHVTRAKGGHDPRVVLCFCRCIQGVPYGLSDRQGSTASAISRTTTTVLQFCSAWVVWPLWYQRHCCLTKSVV